MAQMLGHFLRATLAAHEIQIDLDGAGQPHPINPLAKQQLARRFGLDDAEVCALGDNPGVKGAKRFFGRASGHKSTAHLRHAREKWRVPLGRRLMRDRVADLLPVEYVIQPLQQVFRFHCWHVVASERELPPQPKLLRPRVQQGTRFSKQALLAGPLSPRLDPVKSLKLGQNL